MPDTATYNEKELLLLLAQGNEGAFSQLFHKHYPTLMFFAQRFVSFETAQELISETFHKFWSSKNTFQSEGQIYQWLKITLRNAALNQLKIDKRNKDSLERLKFTLESSYESTFYEARIEAELFGKIVAEIEKLPAQQKNIVRMFFIDGMDNSSIARELNISVQAVKNQKVSALKTLRKTLSANDLLILMLFADAIF